MIFELFKDVSHPAVKCISIILLFWMVCTDLKLIKLKGKLLWIEFHVIQLTSLTQNQIVST